MGLPPLPMPVPLATLVLQNNEKVKPTAGRSIRLG
jgi:hypothetical protein